MSKSEVDILEEKWRDAFSAIIRIHEDRDSDIDCANFAFDEIESLNKQLRLLPATKNWESIQSLVATHDNGINELMRLLPKRPSRRTK